MAKPLTAFQLINSIKKLLPRGINRGAEVTAHLLKRGYIWESQPKTHSLCHGVKPSLTDAETLAKEIDRRAKTFVTRT